MPGLGSYKFFSLCGLEGQREKRRSNSKAQLLRAGNPGGISALNKRGKEETPSAKGFPSPPWNPSPPGAQSSCSEATREGLPAVRVPGGWGHFPENSALSGASILCISKMMGENLEIQSMKSGRQIWGSINIILIGCNP